MTSTKFDDLFDTLITIDSALKCPRCNSDCLSQYPKDFMLQAFPDGSRSYILCVSCDWEISGDELERSLFCQ